MKNPVAEAVGLPDSPLLTSRAAKATGIAFLELNCERRNVGITQAVCEDAFLLALQLEASHDFDLYADGRRIQPEGFDAGVVGLFDLRMNLASDLRDPFHAVDLYLPRKALVALGDDGDIPRHIQDLRHTPGAPVRDPVARDLLLSMRPALAARPEETPDLFVDHVALALTIHVAHRYGGGGPLRDVVPANAVGERQRRADARGLEQRRAVHRRGHDRQQRAAAAVLAVPAEEIEQ
jgi:hypothetical protein